MNDLQAALTSIRSKASALEVRITQHAQQEMTEEAIGFDDVLKHHLQRENHRELPGSPPGSLLLAAWNGSDRPGYARRLYHGSAEAYHCDGLLAIAAQVDFTDATENRPMRCSIENCPGEYESKTVIHTVRSKGRVLVIDHVPADVCSVCGDVLFTPQTVRHIEALLADLPEPARNVPLFEYA